MAIRYDPLYHLQIYLQHLKLELPTAQSYSHQNIQPITYQNIRQMLHYTCTEQANTVLLMEKYGISLDMITFTHLMKGYNTAGKVSNGLKWKPSPAQLFYKCVAKGHGVQKKFQLYSQIEDILKYEFDKESVRKSLIDRVVFEEAILVYLLIAIQ